MIIKIKNADFSATGFGKLPTVTAETLAIISALGKTLTNSQKVGLQVFLNEIDPIKSKIDILAIPALASTKEKAHLNILSLFQPSVSTGTLNDLVLTDAGIRRDYTVVPQTSFTVSFAGDTRVPQATNLQAHSFIYAKNEGYTGTSGFGDNLYARVTNDTAYGGVGAFQTNVNTDVVGTGINYFSFNTTAGTATVLAKLNNRAKVNKTVAAVAGGAASMAYSSLFGKMRNPVSIFTYGKYLTSAEIDILENATKRFMSVLGL